MDNYQMVVGSEDCPLKTVVSIVRKSSVIRSDWSTFARQLDVPSEQINRLRQDLLLNKITLEDLIVEVLEMWIGRNSSNARLASILQVVEEHCGANDVGELLRLEYKLQCKQADSNPSIEWKELSPAFQNRVIETFQHFTPNLKFTDVLPKLNGAALVSLMIGKNPHILSFPEKLSYYVSRTIVTRNIISSKIFDQNSSDIFLFSGVDRDELSVLAKDKLTGSSRQQLYCSSMVKFMILDQESHFERICGKTNDPVHLLKREGDGKLRWMKSAGNMHSLRKYIDDEQDELGEGQFCQTCDSRLSPVLICDTPGMGKSVLLAQVGYRLDQSYPNRTVVFIALSEFIKLAKSYEVEDKLNMIELTLQNWTEKAIPQPKMNLAEETAEISIELLLDGYDEVDSDERKFALEILQIIAKSFKCIRLWITSRPQLMYELENNLNVLGYNIRPFHEENQVQFLSSFWSRKVQLNQEKVELFAKHCLQSLKATMNPFDNDIAGIPLQCLLIGEVYEDDALEYAKLGSENELNRSAGPEIEIGTITNLYSQLIKTKFKKYVFAFENAKLSEDDLMTIHSHLSLELLFPSWHEALRLTKAGEIDIEDLLKGGILTSTRSGNVTFMHRTIAEYFVASFIFDKLQQEDEWEPDLADLILLNVMGCATLTLTFELDNVDNSFSPPSQHQFLHPVICNFLNTMITNLQIDILPNNFPSESNSKLHQLTLAEKIASACVEVNFVQIFELFHKRRTFDKLPSEFFKVDLLLLAVRNSSVELMKSLLTHFERHHKFDLDAQKATLRETVKHGKFSILEFLIKEKRLGGIVDNFKNRNLVCDCVEETIHSSDEVIGERSLVLRMLVRIKGSLVDGLNGSPATTPILSKAVHAKLLIELVGLGANLLAQNEEGHTVLHLSSFNYYVIKTVPVIGRDISNDYLEDITFHQYLEAVPGLHKGFDKLVMSIPMTQLKKLVPMKTSNRKNETALMTILERFDPLPETLHIFHDAGADFNQLNEKGDSVLAIAIKKGRSADTIRTLVQLGAVIETRLQTKRTGSFRNPYQTMSLLHIAAQFGNVDAVGVLLDDCKIDLDTLDENGWTPLDHTIHSIIFAKHTKSSKQKCLETGLKLFQRGGSFQNVVASTGKPLLHLAAAKNLESVKLLIQLGVDVNGIDNEGNTPLHVAAQLDPDRSNDSLSDRHSIIQHLLENGSDPSALNNLNEMPFHTFIKNKDRDLKIFQLFKSTWDERSLWTPAIATLALRYAISGEDAFLDKELEDLVQKEADFNWKDDDGNSLLHLAANHMAVKFLMRMGINVNSRNNSGQSPLQKAASSKQATSFDVLTCLIENGANPLEITTDFGRNLLHLAARGTADGLKYFLELGGIDVNETDSNGNTALHCVVACSKNANRIESLEKSRLLLEHGADVNILNCGGYTPRRMAMMRHYKNKPLIELLHPTM